MNEVSEGIDLRFNSDQQSYKAVRNYSVAFC